VLYDVERKVDVKLEKVTEKLRPIPHDTHVHKKVVVVDEPVVFVDGRVNQVQ